MNTSTTNNSTLTHSDKYQCYELQAELYLVKEQKNNLFKSAELGNIRVDGWVKCVACTGGPNANVTCATSLHQENGPYSPLQATHIHKSSTGDGRTGMGPPVLAGCGNANRVPAPYSQTCHQVQKSNLIAAHKKLSMTLIPGAFRDMEDAVKDLVANPKAFYYNFHSEDSLVFWNAIGQDPVGFVAGPFMSATPVVY